MSSSSLGQGRRSLFVDVLILSSTSRIIHVLPDVSSRHFSHSSVEIPGFFTYAQPRSTAARFPINDFKIAQPDPFANTHMKSHHVLGVKGVVCFLSMWSFSRALVE